MPVVTVNPGQEKGDLIRDIRDYADLYGYQVALVADRTLKVFSQENCLEVTLLIKPTGDGREYVYNQREVIHAVSIWIVENQSPDAPETPR